MISKWAVLGVILLAISCIYPVHAEEKQQEGAAVGEEKQQEGAAVDEEKQQILGRLDSVEEGLKITRKCVSEAKTPAELDRCYELKEMQKFEAVQDMIFEMGSSWEERRYRRMLPEKW
ncbi:MAG TPA: hypothetical protein VLD40_06490 [Dissulfurispiraceae bacterium]|jgi:hypothetical protein|nr:hypothetical protein [Dissulfurispiraceae bacterium]